MELRSRYRQDGYCAPLEAFSADEIGRYRLSFDTLEQAIGPDHCETGLKKQHFHHQFIWQMVTDARILDAITACIGADVVLLSTHYFCKYPDAGANRYVAWHQDVTYWGLEPPEAITAWIAIDDADLMNGCMQVIPGSHQRGTLSHGTSTGGNNLLSINQDIPLDALETDHSLPVQLTAGQFSLHHGQLVHGSAPNPSTRRRRGLTARYIAPTVRQIQPNAVGDYWEPVLLRGHTNAAYPRLRRTPFPN